MKPRALLPERVVALTQDLVRIPSVNPFLAPGAGSGEAAIAEFIAQRLRSRGVEATLEEVAPGRPNVVGRVGRGAGPTLVLCAHIDTVDVSGMSIPPFEPRFEALAEIDFEGRVLLALVADEEYTSLGADHFVAHHKADGCILTEASEGALIVAHKGFVWATVRAHGRAAHGSRWDIGRSAIGSAGRIAAALEAFDAKVLRSRTHELVGPASLHCATIEGGAGLSTYAPECVLRVERRTLPGETSEKVIEELRTVVAAAGEAETTEVTLDFARPPLTGDPESALASTVRAAINKVAGAAPPTTGVGYWMDAAVFAAAGIPAVDYGPTGAGAHEAVEWVDAESVVRCAEVLFESARRFCAKAG
jgi:acetylornithine deacetylase